MKFIGKSGKTIVEHLQDMLNEPAIFAEMTGYQTDAVREAIKTLAEDNNVPVKQPAPTTGLVPCGCKYCDPTHGQRYLYKENKNAPYRGMISTVEITEDDCKKYSQIEGNLYDENGNNFYFVFDIRHCPMCGRELQVAL